MDRYTLREQLGAGGMGVVFRAYDRLTGETVALKKVTIPAANLEFTTMATEKDAAFALASEFRMLAALRHPHIVSVLDYGFDSENVPYYTMALLDSAQSITAAAAGQPLADQMRLVLEMLQALVYLHRQGVIHRDLKPANVLVTQTHSVKVMDFGLAMRRDQADEQPQGISGTLAYMAPEILQMQPPSAQADLYAVGVMLYEILTGRHPYDLENIVKLPTQILSAIPDVSTIEPAFAAVISRLLAKNPAHRYASADAVIAALCQASGQPVPAESSEIRESFLQSSAFVGRDAELMRLRVAQQEALRGHGSAWLIGGESGVGKSRLLDELRTRALVKGMLVVRGQGTAGNGLPYQMWRDVMRRLVLTVSVSDLEAAILKEIVPDIAAILEREIESAPALEAKAAQQRLVLTIQDVFKRQPQPIMLILEDMQWATESLEPVKGLIELVEDHQWLIVGSYRDDEAPDLPERMPSMTVIKLARLSESAISDLSAAMLGDAGRRTDLVDLLQEETEGNAYFLIEVVRALAEQAGSLDAVGRETLSRHVMTGGLMEVTRRKLARLPDWAQEILKLSAVAGREIDPALLAEMGVAERLEEWLTIGANTTVLDLADGRWRFSHDKLRETVLADLTAHEIPALHRRVAAAIERLHPDDRAYAERLADHWDKAGDSEKAIEYLLQGAENMISVTADYGRAERLLKRGLARLGETGKAARRAQFYRWLGESAEKQGAFADARANFEQSLKAAAENSEVAVHASIGLAITALRRGNYEEASQHGARGLELARSLGDWVGIAAGLEQLGRLAMEQAYYPEAKSRLDEALGLRREHEDRAGIASILNNQGVMAWYQGEYATAEACYKEALQLYEELGHRAGAAKCLYNLGGVACERNDYETGRLRFEESLKIKRDIGDQQGIASSMISLTMIDLHENDYEAARAHLQSAHDLYKKIGNRFGVAHALHSLAATAYQQGSYTAARDYAEQGLQQFREIDHREWIGECLFLLSILNVLSGNITAVRPMIAEICQMAQSIKTMPVQEMALLCTGFYMQARGRAAEAAGWLGWMTHHKASPVEHELQVSQLRERLESSLSAESLAAAYERGATLDAEQVIDSLVERLADS